jgi:hypothetical protein
MMLPSTIPKPPACDLIEEKLRVLHKLLYIKTVRGLIIDEILMKYPLLQKKLGLGKILTLMSTGMHFKNLFVCNTWISLELASAPRTD